MYTCRVDYRSLLVNWLGRQEVGFYGEVDHCRHLVLPEAYHCRKIELFCLF